MTIRNLNRVNLVLTTLIFISPIFVNAQTTALEEIVVTAQRRVQSLQEVPIAVEVFSGESISSQGFRHLDDLSKFSASVKLEVGMQEQDVTIRGFGTPGNNDVLMSATPIISDGIYFGRNAMVKTAFLDVDRLEVLKGPQPLFYGLNATAGAFNIISKRPTPVWEGEVSLDYGDDNKNKLFGAVGGPLTDSLGMRVALLSDRTDGPVKNNVDPTKRIGGYDNLAGRLTIAWEPNEKLNITTKFEGARQRNGSEIRMGCLTEGDASGYVGRGGPYDTQGRTDDAAVGIYGYGAAVLAPVSAGGLPYNGSPIQKLRRATGADCLRDKYAMNVEGPYPQKPSYITGEETNTLDGGAVDYQLAADGFWGDKAGVAPEGEYDAFYGLNVGGIIGEDHIDTMNALLDITYTLDNGYSLNSLTGVIDWERYSKRDNSPSPFLQNFQVRHEKTGAWSQQLQLHSSSYNLDFAGGSSIDYMLGGVAQKQYIDTENYFPKDGVRRGDRTNVVWEDTTWYSAFWNVNFNFVEDQFSLQFGGRFTDVTKQGYLQGASRQMIFEGKPCLSTGTDANPATCTQDPNFKRVHPELTSYTLVDPITGLGSAVNREVRVDSPIITVNGVDQNDLWTPREWNRAIGIPLNYRSPIGRAVGFTAPVYTNREGGPWGPCDLCLEDLYTSVSGYDSQVVLTFTPNQFDRHHTFYGKYAEAFKGPASDLAPGPIPDNLGDLNYDQENSEIWELGAKGRILDNRVMYDSALFITTFTDLQYSAAGRRFVPEEEVTQASLSLNAGKQRTKGFEFSVLSAITDNLSLKFAGALLEGKMLEFDGGGCTTNEVIAASIDALTSTAQGGSMENRTAEEISLADDSLNNLGAKRRANLPARSELPEEFFINGGCRLKDELEADGSGFLEGTINRSGEEVPRTPDWTFVAGLDYEYPLWNNYLYNFNITGFISDGYLTEETSFTRLIKFNRHGDFNLTAGIGTQDRKWRVLAYARNILQATKSYNPEYDLERAGIFQTENASSSSFFQYGVRFEYNFR